MNSHCRSIVVRALLLLVASLPAAAQERPDPAALIAAQRQAMTALGAIHGTWRGPAWILLPSGERRESIQTERIGPFLDGSVIVIEGRSHDPAGKVIFNAFGIVSYNATTRLYSLRSYALGTAGDFKFAPTADGYAWEIQAGPVKILYSAVITDGTLKEVGDRVVPGKDPVRIFEMNLKRVGSTDWPVAGAIGPQ